MAKKTQSPPKSFEDAMRELEAILAEVEGGDLGLESSLQKYERGIFLFWHCRGVLDSAEKQIEILSKGPDGGLVSTPAPVAQAGETGGSRPALTSMDEEMDEGPSGQ